MNERYRNRTLTLDDDEKLLAVVICLTNVSPACTCRTRPCTRNPCLLCWSQDRKHVAGRSLKVRWCWIAALFAADSLLPSGPLPRQDHAVKLPDTFS